MRIAAGVLIIIAATLDLFGSFGYLLVGGASSAVGQASSQAARGELTEEDAKKAAEELATGAKKAGAMWTAYGAFLLVLAGMGIATGVVLFREKAAMFAIVTGALQVAADGISVVSWGHVGITNLLGFAAGALAILAAMSYKNKVAGAAPVATM